MEDDFDDTVNREYESTQEEEGDVATCTTGLSKITGIEQTKARDSFSVTSPDYVVPTWNDADILLLPMDDPDLGAAAIAATALASILVEEHCESLELATEV
eukprot:6495728-Ditylum_brightwellii.AAC.1